MLHNVPRVQFVIRSKRTGETLCEIKKMKKEGRKKELDNAIWADKITRERRKAIDEKKGRGKSRGVGEEFGGICRMKNEGVTD